MPALYFGEKSINMSVPSLETFKALVIKLLEHTNWEKLQEEGFDSKELLFMKWLPMVESSGSMFSSSCHIRVKGSVIEDMTQEEQVEFIINFLKEDKNYLAYLEERLKEYNQELETNNNDWL
jgi:hypothetical protein